MRYTNFSTLSNSPRICQTYGATDELKEMKKNGRKRKNPHLTNYQKAGKQQVYIDRKKEQEVLEAENTYSCQKNVCLLL